MKERRAKVVAVGTAVGLAALGGAALGSNHGLPTQLASVGNGRAPIVTGASGSTVSAHGSAAVEGRREPIVTRASTTAAGGATVDD